MDESAVRKFLREHGWEGGTFGVLSFGGQGGVDLDFDPEPNPGEKFWGLTLNGADGCVQLWVYPGGNPKRALEEIKGFQDDISLENFREKVRSLLKVAEKVELQQGEDGEAVELVDE